ncbi:MAG TPA: site-2 protease family protein [Acidimicrobiales bacterium]|nr:site-2 protease family protein [Acidimicrobiales bacterium]
MGPPPGGRPGGRNQTGVLIIAAVLALLVYEITKAHRISSTQVIFFLVLIPSVILHEVSHGVMALAFGDDTAKRAGRLTLNPIRHIDPIGTIVLPVIMVLTVHSAFGYAKPVPVNVRRLRHPRNDAVLVGLVGPAVNIALAVGSAAALRYLAPAGAVPPPEFVANGYVPSQTLWQVVFMLGFANMILAAFNLIPIPPLDGSAVVERLLPRSWWPTYLSVRMYAMPVLILIVLLIPSVTNHAETWGLEAWSHFL